MYFIQRHPLEDLLPGQPPEPAADHLTVLLRPTVLTVLASKAQIDGLPALQGVSLRQCGPMEWLLVSDDINSDAVGRNLTEAGLRWVDQSNGYAVVRLSGPHARAILAKGMGVDLHPASFALGDSANALCGQVHVNLARVAENTFELAVMRSYASFFFQTLMQSGKEFCLTAAFERSLL